MYRKHSESMRIAVLDAYWEAEFSVRKVARLFHIGVQTIYRWVAIEQLRARQAQSALVAREPEPEPEPFVNRGRKKLLSEPAQRAILVHLEHRKILEWVEVSAMLHRQFQLQPSKSTVYRCLAAHNMSYKKTHFRERRTDPNKMQAFRRAIQQTPHSSIVSLDESSFDTHLTPLYGWSRKGTKCIVFPRKSRRSRKRFSLLLATSNQQVLAWQLVEGSFNKQRFMTFLEHKLLPAMIPHPHICAICSWTMWPSTTRKR